MSFNDSNDEFPLVVSPCVNVCALDPGTDICYGCLRTLDEITGWSQASNSERLEILAAVERRRAERHPRTGG